MNEIPDTRRAAGGGYFVTTRWTLILSAGRKSSPDSDAALAELCQTYWYPLYAYLRRQNRTREDAEDLTQAFFAAFLERNYLEGLSAERGKFRAFMLAALKHFVANEWDKASRQKRGGGVPHLSLDWESADQRYHMDVGHEASPDRAFDREWALALLERVVRRLEEEYGGGRAALFSELKGALMMNQSKVDYAAASQSLGMEEGALRVAAHRLKKRYREVLREEIGQTLLEPGQVEEELRSLQEALGG